MPKTIADFADLTPPQRALLERLEREDAFTKNFYFTGGTLLKALGIVPRESNDLDFFTFPEVEGRTFVEVLGIVRRTLGEAFGTDAIDETDRGFVLKEHGVFIECIYDIVPLIDATIPYGKLQTVGIKDIAACKAGALCSRDEVKDYIDVAFLTKKEGWLLPDLEQLAEEKYRLGTVTEEKLLEELLHKRDLFIMTTDRFLRDGESNVKLVNEQIEHLLQSTLL